MLAGRGRGADILVTASRRGDLIAKCDFEMPAKTISRVDHRRLRRPHRRSTPASHPLPDPARPAKNTPHPASVPNQFSGTAHYKKAPQATRPDRTHDYIRGNA